MFFSKKKSVLTDLLAEGHTDIHSHILPGIDDGAKSVDDSMTLLKSLHARGMRRFVATPHVMSGVYDNSPADILAALYKVQAAAAAQLPDIEIFAAAEYMLDSQFPELLSQRQLLPIKDNLVLVEMSYLNPPLQLHQLIFDIQVAGYVPILAHPERYTFYHRSADELRKLKRNGCLFQMNLLSSVGYYGAPVAELASKLLKEGLIDFVGSDVHHENHLAAFDRRIVFKDSKPLEEAISQNRYFT